MKLNSDQIPTLLGPLSIPMSGSSFSIGFDRTPGIVFYAGVVILDVEIYANPHLMWSFVDNRTRFTEDDISRNVVTSFPASMGPQSCL